MKKAKIKIENIRKNNYSIGTMILTIAFGLIGLLFIYSSGVFSLKSWALLYDCIYEHPIEIIWGLFFIIISIYNLTFYLLNFVLPPKKEVVYLSKTRENGIYFLDKKGKKYEYNMHKKNIKWNSYYKVIKTHNFILDILDEASEDWKPKEKKSFWLNFYTPFGNVEDVFILPIVYVVAFPVILSFLMSKGEVRFYGLLLCSIPIYVFIYDIVYKIKLRLSKDNRIDETAFKKSYKLFKNWFVMFIAFLFTVGAITTLNQLLDNNSKIFSLSIIGCGICTVGLAFSRIFNKSQLEKIFQKGYIVIFLLYWFGIIIYWIFALPKTKDAIPLLLFPIPFWIFGFLILFRFVIENNKEEK